MNGRVKLGLAVAVVSAAAFGAVAVARDGPATQERLSGYEETPAALSTSGEGRLELRVSSDEFFYRLSYSDLEQDVTQAHIHLGAPAQTGGVAAFLCSNQDSRPAGVQTCPPRSGTIEGTIGPAQVIGPNAQGIAAGEFEELVDAVRAGATYVNVHTEKYPGGEIRAQIERGGGGE